jgi:predicted AlkP superfamily pyrophosphatase or phosphodiesterase
MLPANPSTMIRLRQGFSEAALRRTAMLVLCLVLLTAGIPRSERTVAAQTPARPKLVVILVVDQMRADYLDWYGANFTAGLKRLMQEGAWFTQAAYPYLNTITCPGHSTVGTGSFPYHHGMILNNWYDRSTGKSPYCTDDPTVTEISYNNLAPVQGDSAKLLMRPAIGEQILARGGRSVAFSLKPRSAITLTGHKATAVAWFDDRGGWATSTAFTPGPVPFVKQFIDSHPLTADVNKVWERSLPIAKYQGEDDGKGEGTLTGGTRTFPHPLAIEGKADATFYSRWQRTPYADEYLEGMAESAIDALKLGRGPATDFLGVSFSVLDGVGHIFGPRSHEIQDTLVRLDKTVGRLLDHLDATVGRRNYVVGLTADHGVADIPEQAGKGGRIASKVVTEAVQKVLVPALGPGTHVLSTLYTDISLTDAARARLQSDLKLRAAVFEALRGIDGVAHALWGPDLGTEAARQSDDPIRRAAALSYYPSRSGDIIIIPGENWLLSTAVTTHGTYYPYDQRVPVILYGGDVRAGRYTDAATPADVMPSVAALAKVAIAPTDGRILREAMRKK